VQNITFLFILLGRLRSLGLRLRGFFQEWIVIQIVGKVVSWHQ
jgi:hypothetical protein